MEDLLTHLIKLTTIFIGSGCTTLFAYWVFKETSTIPKLIFDAEIKKKNHAREMSILNHEKVSSRSGMYEIMLSNEQRLKLFSSHKGMKII